MGFVIERNALTDGAFSSSEDDSLLMTGSIVSDVSAMGRIDTAA
jgi:hypothetical protein